MKKTYISPNMVVTSIGLSDEVMNDVLVRFSQEDDSEKVKEENPWWGEDGGSSSTTTSKSIWDEEW